MEDAILKKLKDEEPEAMLTFYEKLQPLMYECVIRLVKNHSDAEDIVSETIIEFINKKKYLNIRENLLGYLMIACRNKCWNYMKVAHQRSLVIRKYHNALPEHAKIYISKHLDVEEEIRKEQEEWLQTAIEKLPKTRKQILKMRYIQGKKPKQIAKETNKNPELIKRQLSLGINNLKELYKIK